MVASLFSQATRAEYSSMTKSILADKVKFAELAAQARSGKEMLELAGLRAAGGNFAQLKKYSKLHEIPLPEYDDSRRVRDYYTGSPKWTTENVFTENCAASRFALKRELRKVLTAWECSECGLSEQWQGKPLTLTVDHVNGVFNDNRLENLAVLCPNCHSQTETFAGRNRKTVISAGVLASTSGFGPEGLGSKPGRRAWL